MGRRMAHPMTTGMLNFAAVPMLCLLLLWALLRPIASDTAYASEHQARVAAEARSVSLEATVTALKPVVKCPPSIYRC
jgi:hypothetical protein